MQLMQLMQAPKREKFVQPPARLKEKSKLIKGPPGACRTADGE
jgi:hypothetical protein